MIVLCCFNVGYVINCLCFLDSVIFSSYDSALALSMLYYLGWPCLNHFHHKINLQLIWTNTLNEMTNTHQPISFKMNTLQGKS